MIAVARARRRLAGLSRRPGARWSGAAVTGALNRHPRRVAVVAAAGVTIAAGLAAGPVAGGLAAAYAAVAGTVAVRSRRQRAADVALADALDAVGGLAADLRAGAQPAEALAVVRERLTPVAGPVTVAWQVSERTGAPIADVLDRVESQLSAVARVRRTAAAHAAGARATAWLLAALPAAGIALGVAIGADPLRTLLHTPLGAVCASVAAALQLAGVAWSARLARLDVT